MELEGVAIVEPVMQTAQEGGMMGAPGESPARAVITEDEGLGGGVQTSLPSVLALHQMWEAHKVRAYNEVLAGGLQPEVDLLHKGW